MIYSSFTVNYLICGRNFPQPFVSDSGGKRIRLVTQLYYVVPAKFAVVQCFIFCTSLFNDFDVLAGSSHKPKIATIVGVIGGVLGLLLLVGLLFLVWKGRRKRYQREIFVDVAGL